MDFTSRLGAAVTAAAIADATRLAGADDDANDAIPLVVTFGAALAGGVARATGRAVRDDVDAPISDNNNFLPIIINASHSRQHQASV